MSLYHLVGAELEWTRPHILTPEYELCHNSDVVGSLKFRSAFGSFATATVDLGCWTFERTGFIKTRVTVKACDSEREIGVFHNNTWTGGGTLELPGGRAIQANTNFWHSKYEFTKDGETLVTYRSLQRLTLTGRMAILPPAQDMPELPWLMMLGWSLAVMMHRDESAACVAVPS